MLSIASWLEEQGGLPLYTVEGTLDQNSTLTPRQLRTALLQHESKALCDHMHCIKANSLQPVSGGVAGDEPAQQAAEWSLPGMQPAVAAAAQQGQPAASATSSAGGSPVPAHRTQSTSSDGSSCALPPSLAPGSRGRVWGQREHAP